MKKLFISITFLLSFMAVKAQQLPSELNKGLVFHAPLSEWYPTKDLVSGTNGTATAVYNISDKQGSGNNRYFSFNGTSDYITLPTLSAFGSADFSITGKIKTGEIGAVRTIIGGATNSFELYISATGYLTAIKNGGSALTASTTLLAANTEYTFAYVRSSTTGTYYINGTAAGTCTDSNNYSVECTLLGKGTGYFNGYQFMVRAFNYALSSVVNYSKPEYPIEYADRDGGATICVLDLNSSGLSRASDGSYNTGYWTDRTNQNSAQVVGATSVIPPASNLNATWFNGTSSVINSTTNKLDSKSTFTISAWINLQSVTPTWNPIVIEGLQAGSGVMLATLQNKLALVIPSGSYDRQTSTASLTANTWVHCVATYNSGTIKLYINGSYDSTGTGFTKTTSGGDPLTIGGAINTLGSWSDVYANGAISNVIIYDKVLDSDQIRLLYDLGH